MTEVTIYDIGQDAMRPVTQADVDGLLKGIQIMARHRAAVAVLDQMCRDALRGDMPVDQHIEITGYLSDVYTSKEAQQRQQDESRGRRERMREERLAEITGIGGNPDRPLRGNDLPESKHSVSRGW